jgi:hypothetical protein
MDDSGHRSGIVGILKNTFGKCKVRVTRDPLDFHVSVNNRKSDRHWEKVAHACVEKSLDPRCYVEWRFHMEFPQYPVPAKFASERMLDEYVRQGKPDVRYIQVRKQWELMSHKLNLLVEHGQEQLRCLLDVIHDFDPVFIYTVAALADRQHELPDHILIQARNHATWNPVYEARFSDLVPQEVFKGGSH